jgi:hypothetical protein
MEETADRYNEVTGRTLGIGWYLKTLTHEVGMMLETTFVMLGLWSEVDDLNHSFSLQFTINNYRSA